MSSVAYFSTRISGRRTRRSSGGGRDTTLDNSREEGGNDSSNNSSSSRSGGGYSNNRNNIVSTGISMEQFESAANNLLDMVEGALVKLKDCNDRLEINRRPPTNSLPSPNDDSSIDDTTTTTTLQKHGGQLCITVQSSTDLYWGGGTYSLTIYPDDSNDASEDSTGYDVRVGGGFVTLQSPLSGTYSYIYNNTTKEWVGEDDGHSLLGMLTRDWIRQCNGVPDF